jgi:gamma-glutamyltranspeptidase / glutathione hydrolase
MNKMKRVMVLAPALALATPGLAAAPSPADWPAAERNRLEQRESAVWPTDARTVTSPTGMVSATASPIAVHAGVQMLRAGGTAADAAVATALTQITTMLGANVSFAGVAQLLYYDAKTRTVYAMDAGWNGWRGEASPETIPATDLSLITGTGGAVSGAAGRKTLVPGFMAGMAAMHDRFGRLPFRQLFAQSIWYARHGVPVTPLLATYFSLAAKDLERTPDGRRFAMPDGIHLSKSGDRHGSPELASLLERIASRGPAEMYRGRWAKDFVKTVNAAGGHATMADMAAYRVRWMTPVKTSSGDADVFAPDNSAGCAILTALNVLDHGRPTTNYWEDARTFRNTALTLRLATVLGWSPQMGAAIQQRLGIGADCRSRLRPAFGAAAANSLESLLDSASPLTAGHHSGSVVAIDRWGNIAALVHSSNTPLWGDTGLVVDGVAIPAPAGLYRQALIATKPGGRVRSDMAPLIAFRSGRPLYAVATIGSSEVQEAVRIMAGLTKGSADPAALLSAPPLLLNFEQVTGPILKRDELVPANRYPKALLNQVRADGMPVRELDEQRVLTLRGTAALGQIGADGARKGEEVPHVLEFMEAE